MSDFFKQFNKNKFLSDVVSEKADKGPSPTIRNIIYNYPQEQDESDSQYFNRIRDYANYFYDHQKTLVSMVSRGGNLKIRYVDYVPRSQIDPIVQNEYEQSKYDIQHDIENNELTPVRLQQMTRFMNRGLTLPFSHNTGPLNTLVSPSNTADEHAYAHDIAYSKGGDVSEVDQAFIDEMFDHYNEDPLSVEGLTGLLGGSGIMFKKYVEKFTGQLYPFASGNYVKT